MFNLLQISIEELNLLSWSKNKQDIQNDSFLKQTTT